MKKIIFLLNIFVVSVLLFACNSNTKHPHELATADSLSAVIKKTDSVFRIIDTTEVNKTLSKISYALEYIQFNTKDTMKFEEAKLLSDFHSLKKPLAFFSKEYKEIFKRINEQKEQCSNLAHDLKFNTLDEKLNLSKCLLDERSHVNQILQTTEMLLPVVLDALKKYKEQLPGIDKRVNELRGKGGKEPEGIQNKQNVEEND